MKTKTYSIYLAKKTVIEFEEILKNDNLIEDPNPIESREFGEGGRLFIFENKLDEPVWYQDVKSVFTDMPKLKNDVSYGVIVFKQSGRIFAAAFGHGWQYINDEKVEKDFGLKVALNLLDASKINKIEAANLGESMKTASHSPFQRDFQAFGVDDALNLLNRITGKTANSDFANTISGATSFRFSKKMDITELPSVADAVLGFYLANGYASDDFRSIDKLRPVGEKTLQNELDEIAVDKIIAGEDNFELSIPGWSGEEIDLYKFVGFRSTESFPELLLSDYREALGEEKLKDLNPKIITSKHTIVANLSNDNIPPRKFSIKNALIGTVVLEGGLYAIYEGQWYRLDEAFKNSINGILPKVAKQWEGRWGNETPLRIKEITKDGETRLQTELEYNNDCAEKYGLICLDRELLGGNPDEYKAFEACDLLDIRNKKLIHVKKSSRHSNLLSHLFKQGVNSAKLLKFYDSARQALIDKVEEEKREELREALGESLAGWTVEFHMIDFEPRVNGKSDIPFFSKITLKDEYQKLKLMNIDVALIFVPELPLAELP